MGKGPQGTTNGNPTEVVGVLFFLILRAFLPLNRNRGRVPGETPQNRL